jgi:hypothetical protein
VQQHIREVIPERVHSPHGVIDAEAEPCHWDPVAHDRAGEGPADLGPAQAAVERIVQEIAVVVPEKEAVLERRREHREGDRGDRERRDPPDHHVDTRGARLGIDRPSTIGRRAPSDQKRPFSA